MLIDGEMYRNCEITDEEYDKFSNGGTERLVYKINDGCHSVDASDVQWIGEVKDEEEARTGFRADSQLLL